MATTRPLNDDESVWVTTYFGGPDKGRCYDFTVVLGDFDYTTTLTESELRTIILTRDNTKVQRHIGTPSFDRIATDFPYVTAEDQDWR